MPRDSTFNCEGKVLRCTQAAFLFQMTGGPKDPAWIPFSVLVEPDEKSIRETLGEEIDIEIPEWIAREKGFF